MPRKILRGSGMTKQEVTRWEGEDETRQWFESQMQAIKENGGEFGALTLPISQQCEAILRAPRNLAGDNDPIEDTEQSFAGRVKAFVEMAKECIQKGNADLAARHAWTAGYLWAQATMKWQWEAHALRGEKVATAASDGASKTNARHKVQREKRMARMAELVPELGVDSAAAECEHLGLGRRQGIKRQWYRRKEKV